MLGLIALGHRPIPRSPSSCSSACTPSVARTMIQQKTQRSVAGAAGCPGAGSTGLNSSGAVERRPESLGRRGLTAFHSVRHKSGQGTGARRGRGLTARLRYRCRIQMEPPTGCLKPSGARTGQDSAAPTRAAARHPAGPDPRGSRRAWAGRDADFGTERGRTPSRARDPGRCPHVPGVPGGAPDDVGRGIARSSACQVAGGPIPSAVSPCACWKATTADCVLAPKPPVNTPTR